VVAVVGARSSQRRRTRVAPADRPVRTLVFSTIRATHKSRQI